MHSARKMTAIAGAALSALVLAGLLLVPSGAALAGPPEPRELPGLREAPDIPVGSIFLRRELPGHPLPPPVDREFPGPDAPGLEGRPAPGGGGCDKDIDLTGQIDGVVNVGYLDTGICTNADIDTYVSWDGGTYVVQAGGEQAAWILTDVSDIANNQNQFTAGRWNWQGRAGKATYTPDVKAFHQGEQDYIVLALERTKITGACGVIIYNVTSPFNPVQESQFIGSDWCDTHNVFVETGENGDGQYIYATADATNDLRVLDISGGQLGGSVDNPVEIGRYTAPFADNDNFVHDVTVIDHGDSVGRRVYLAYWDSGLVILDAEDVTPGTNPTPIIGPNDLDPKGFLNHHSFPSQDGTFVFIQDEFLKAKGDKPVQMWDISTPANPSLVDSLVLGDTLDSGGDVPINPAHNLEIRYDIDPNRLYVAWYKQGLQAWDFITVVEEPGGDPIGFVRDFSPPRTAKLYHQVQTETADGEYDGAWGVRLEWIGAFLYIFQSDRNFGLIVDCVGCSEPATGTVTGTVTDSSTPGSPIEGASVSADTGGLSATTEFNGVYTLNDVPTGDYMLTASADGFVTLIKAVGVTEDGPNVVDFVLVPVPTGGGTGTIKGTVTDADGTRLRDVTVTTDITEGSVTTNRRGMYSIKNVPAGDVTVTAEADGFVFEQITVEVLIGQTTAGVDFVAAP